MNNFYKDMIVNKFAENLIKHGDNPMNMDTIKKYIKSAIDNTEDIMIKDGKDFEKTGPIKYIDKLINENNTYKSTIPIVDNSIIDDSNSDQKYPAKKIK